MAERIFPAFASDLEQGSPKVINGIWLGNPDLSPQFKAWYGQLMSSIGTRTYGYARAIIDVEPQKFVELKTRLKNRMGIIPELDIHIGTLAFLSITAKVRDILEISDWSDAVRYVHADGIKFGTDGPFGFGILPNIVGRVQERVYERRPYRDVMKSTWFTTGMAAPLTDDANLYGQGFDGRRYTIGVSDSGFSPNRQFKEEDVQASSVLKAETSRDTTVGHGTLCLGILGGPPVTLSTGELVRGLTRSKLRMDRCLYGPGFGYDSWILKSWEPVDFRNNSLGGPPTEGGGVSALNDAINELNAKGTTTMTSTGNDGQNILSEPANADRGLRGGSNSYLKFIAGEILRSFYSNYQPGFNIVTGFGGGLPTEDVPEQEFIVGCTSPGTMMDRSDRKPSNHVTNSMGTSFGGPWELGDIVKCVDYIEQRTGHRMNDVEIWAFIAETGQWINDEVGYGPVLTSQAVEYAA